jgi:hypothetical protein
MAAGFLPLRSVQGPGGWLSAGRRSLYTQDSGDYVCPKLRSGRPPPARSRLTIVTCAEVQIAEQNSSWHAARGDPDQDAAGAGPWHWGGVPVRARRGVCAVGSMP